jgi:hypothetical protein
MPLLYVPAVGCYKPRPRRRFRLDFWPRFLFTKFRCLARRTCGERRDAREPGFELAVRLLESRDPRFRRGELLLELLIPAPILRGSGGFFGLAGSSVCAATSAAMIAVRST